MEPEKINIKDLREYKDFLDALRWDITPKILFEPMFQKQGGSRSLDGYMLYVDIVDNKPVLMVLKNKFGMSETAAYIEGVPEDLLKETTQCPADECIGGMYPITKKLEAWLKNELGLS